MAKLISGYAARFGDEAIIFDLFREKLAPGAFAKSIAENNIVALLDHDSGRVLGRMSAGTLRLREDRVGLWFELDADETTPEGQSAIGTVSRQDVKGCSFGFRVRSEEWQDGGLNLPLRTILEADCHEITLTAFPAYGTTSATLQVRNLGKNAAVVARAEAAMRARGIAV